MNIHDFFAHFSGTSLSYDDLIFLPQYLDFALEELDTTTRLTRDISIAIPISSAPMDTVTEAELAIALALQGGVGIIHYNMPPEEQLQHLQRVKRFKNGLVLDPITLPPTASIAQVETIRREQGYSTIPITENGESHGRLLGMISKYDYSLLLDDILHKQVQERMVPVKELTVATFEELTSADGTFDLHAANHRLLDSHSAAMPIVDNKGFLCNLLTRSDLEKHQNFPLATVDASQGLVVGAAVETRREKAEERLALIHNFVDVIVFDTSQGFNKYEIDLIKWTKKTYPHLQIIGGNIVTADACDALIEAGADAIRVGMGAGSICTTQGVCGVGRAQASAVYHCAKACQKADIPVIADGGITNSGDIVKALAIGASSVMAGSLLAGTREAPGTSHIKNGVRVKEYRGMGSLSAMQQGGASRYGTENSAVRVPEGVLGMVPSRGPVSEWIPCLMQGVRQGLHKLGYRSIETLLDMVNSNTVTLEKRSEAAFREGRVHSLYEVGIERPAVQTSNPAQPSCRSSYDLIAHN